MGLFGFGKKTAPVGNARQSASVLRPTKSEGLAYGLNIKPEHGYYVDIEALDGDVSQIRLVDDSDDGGYLPRGNPILAGRPVDTEHVPTKMKWLDRKGHLVPDFDNGKINNVSARARHVIESKEPGVHQFIPVEYVDKDGNHLEHRFFFFVGNRLDTMYDENPTMVLANGRTWVPASDLARRNKEIPPDKDPSLPARLMVDSQKVGPAQIWVEKHSGGGSTFISEGMFKAFMAAGLTGIKPTPVETV
jgi:hypothetical protein